MRGSDLDSASALQFVEGFSRENRPAIVSLTGGEPLLRPDFVKSISKLCNAVNTRVHLLTGLFFARSSRIPAPINDALRSIDHMAASLDRFHERELSRERVFFALDAVLEMGKEVSLQILGYDESDPYLDDVVADVTTRFGDRVPMLISSVRAIGRGRNLEILKRRSPSKVGESGLSADSISPCSMAAWPVICSDGRITGCCNQEVVDGLRVEHLTLGHVATTNWSLIRHKMSVDPVLRCLRAVGPRFLGERTGTGYSDSYCHACHRLSDREDVKETVGSTIPAPLLEVIEELAVARFDDDNARATGFADEYGVSRFAHLATLGR